MVAVSRYSSSRSKCSTIIPSFRMGLNPSTRALHRFTSADITTSAPYVKENGVSPVDLLGVVRYAHNTLGNSSAHLPFASPNLFFNPFTIVLLMASACPLLWGYVGVEYLFLILRSLQNSRKTLLSNYNPLSDIRESDTPNLVTIFFHTNFLTSTSRMLANTSVSTHLVK